MIDMVYPDQETFDRIKKEVDEAIFQKHTTPEWINSDNRNARSDAERRTPR